MQHLWVVGPICPEEPFGIEAAPAPSPLSALSLLTLNRPPVFAMLAEIEGTWSASLPVPNWAVSAPAFSSQQSLPQADGDTAVQVWVGARSPPSCTDPNEDGNGSVRRGLQNGTGGGGARAEPHPGATSAWHRVHPPRGSGTPPIAQGSQVGGGVGPRLPTPRGRGVPGRADQGHGAAGDAERGDAGARQCAARGARGGGSRGPAVSRQCPSPARSRDGSAVFAKS